MSRYENSLRLAEKDREYVSSFQHFIDYPLNVKKAKGAVLIDADGNRYIDFLSSASSLNLGSSHPVLTRAIRKQLRRTTQYSGVYSINELAPEYAKGLSEVYPGGLPVKVCFGHCGSDANDAAVKIARAYTGRKRIAVFENGYCGSTYGAISMTSWHKGLSEKIGPMLPDIAVLPFYGEGTYSLGPEELEAEFRAASDPDETAAVIIEPVQGEGGMIPADPLFLSHLYALCKKHGILFIAEEVQQGFFRTGTFFSIERYGIVPDGIVIGKSAGAGLALGAFIGRKEMMDVLPPMGHILTLGGTHLACAAGIAQLGVMKTEAFRKRLAENIEIAREELASIREKHPAAVKSVRQSGLSIGIGIRAAGELSPEECAKEIVYRLYRRGLVIMTNSGGILRLQPPLNIDARLLRRGFGLLDDMLAEFEEMRWTRKDLYVPGQKP